MFVLVLDSQARISCVGGQTSCQQGLNINVFGMFEMFQIVLLSQKLRAHHSDITNAERTTAKLKGWRNLYSIQKVILFMVTRRFVLFNELCCVVLR
jgi:hypothetical protein